MSRVGLPWKLCRTCHKRGTKQRPHQHTLMTRVTARCGQCGKWRHLVECHEYDFRRSKP